MLPAVIESVNNPLCKQAAKLLQKKYRDRWRAFLLEGETCLYEALAAGFLPRRIFFRPQGLSPDARAVLGTSAASVPLTAVNAAVIEKIADTVSPPPLIAVFDKISYDFAQLPLYDDTFFLILDEVRDPGNIGTIIRTAAAAGIGAVVLTGNCADPFAPKTVRAAMGALFHIPVIEAGGELVDWLRANSFKIILAAPGGGNIYQTDFSGRTAVVIGNEAHGAGTVWRQAAGRLAGIPMPGRAESLNAAVAAALFIYRARGGG